MQQRKREDQSNCRMDQGHNQVVDGSEMRITLNSFSTLLRNKGEQPYVSLSFVRILLVVRCCNLAVSDDRMRRYRRISIHLS